MTVNTPVTAPGTGPGDWFLTACPTCGAAVFQINLLPHLAWHDKAAQ